MPGDKACGGGLRGSPYPLLFSGSHAPAVALLWRARQCTAAAPAAGSVMNVSGARNRLRVIDSAVLDDPVKRLHRFQGEHPEVSFTAPHMGGHGRYIAVIPAGTIPGEYREITVTSLDLTGLMDQLDDLLPSAHSMPGQPT